MILRRFEVSGDQSLDGSAGEQPPSRDPHLNRKKCRQEAFEYILMTAYARLALPFKTYSQNRIIDTPRPMVMTQRRLNTLFFLFTAFLFLAPSSQGAERLCDVSFEDCRAPILALINSEQVALDTGFWFSDDPRFPQALIAAKNRGVKVRILMDTRAEDNHPQNTTVIQQLVTAGIPMRNRVATGILHWKMMMFASQGTVEFSGANFTGSELVPAVPYVNYTDEAIYFSDDPSVVNSFRTKFDDSWTDVVSYQDYANITPPLARSWPTYPIDPELNFPPGSTQSYGNRAMAAINAEKVKLDVDMFRITSQPIADTTIKAFNRGVAVRMIVDSSEYRNPARVWVSYNVDRLFMAGIPIKITNHMGQNHEKSLLFYGQPAPTGQPLQKMTVFGSSNWTTPSFNSQQEHNYFTKKPWFFQWFVNQFERRWNSPSEYKPFVPLPPGGPALKKPLNAAVAQPLSLTLTWDGGPWGQKYDVYFGTSSNPPLIASDVITGAPQDPSGPLTLETYKVSNLAPGTVYYWKIIDKTMANLTATSGQPWSFTTATPTPPGAGATVTSISPNTGPIAGGTAVTITGTNFVTGATVSFGVATSPKVVFVNSTTLTATTPPHVAGPVNVTVINKAGDNGTLPASFSYSSTPVSTAPRMNLVSPNRGSPSGGDAATITGINFVSGLTVTFGGVPATVNSRTANSINVTTPGGSGPVDVVVTNPDTQSATLKNAFNYTPPPGPPSVGSVTPSSGSSKGGTAITVAGSGFTNGAIVTVGGTRALSIAVVNGSTITATTPSGPLGAADVVVTNMDGQSSTLTGGFTYAAPAPPTISSVSPNFGTVNGGTSITINGTNFQYGASVSIGGRPATVQTVTSSYIYATTPVGQSAVAVDVLVTNPDGQSVTLTGGYTYQ